MEIRSRETLQPFTTKDGSTIREYLHTADQSLAEATLAAGQSTQRHYHASSEEIYLLLEGGGMLEIDGEERAVTAGDCALIPRGAWHQVTASELGARLLCCCTPPYSDEDTYSRSRRRGTAGVDADRRDASQGLTPERAVADLLATDMPRV
jgi:mannose-6-phosphate isomerase-like protein (cupin superfamily)